MWDSIDEMGRKGLSRAQDLLWIKPKWEGWPDYEDLFSKGTVFVVCPEETGGILYV